MDHTTGIATRLERGIAILFVVVCLLPGLALIAGVRPKNLENAAPAAMPTVAPDRLLDSHTYAEIDAFISDNLPGRDRALRTYGELDYGLLGGSASRQVIVGRDDWLFFDGELRPTCRATAAEMLADLDSTAAAAERVGMELRFVVAPDKHGIHPEKVMDDPPWPVPCTDLERPAMRAGFAERPNAAVDLWGPVEAARDAANEPMYFTKDSHWTPTGALAAIEALVESLAPGVWDPTDIGIDGTSTYPMELARLMGVPEDAIVPAYVVRPGVDIEQSTLETDVDMEHAPSIDQYHVTGTDRLVPGTTLVIYDSFFNISRPRITPWFEHTVWVQLEDLRDQPELVETLPPIDRIIVERVERSAYNLDLPALLAPVFERAATSP